MKKIIILQIPNAKNNGSAMMAINTIGHFNSQFNGDVEFFCDFSTEEDHLRVINELSSDILVSKLKLPIFNRGANIYTSFLSRLRWIKDSIEVINTEKPLSILVLGGDDFSEYYSGYKIVVRLYFMYRLSFHFPIYLIGHTIGPFTSWRKVAFRFLMSKCKIITRDVRSLEHCQNDLKHKNSKLGHDLAWFDLPNQSLELKKRMLKKFSLREDDFVVITPSALVEHYAENEMDYITTWKLLIEHLVADDKNIVLMPHVFNHVKRDDRWIINEIKKQLPNITSVTFIEEMLLPSECRAILSSCSFAISCRMHAAVSTIQTGKPAIALSYSAKYLGVIGGDMKLPELVIEASDNTLWKKGLIEKIQIKINLIEENNYLFTNHIISRVKTIQKEQKTIMDISGAQMLEFQNLKKVNNK